MSQRNNRHQRRPSQSIFVLPENISDPLFDETAPPSGATAQPPPPPRQKNDGGFVHMPPQPPSKRQPEEMHSSMKE
ncbi:hypothetical protein CASFOL_027652 [Castilleja foliolosa]|uniref:Uncharacterized protein n=1 Tax=Castilleja foliolosa TaxID=1961234 RepID=A0ABD3CGZ7_9LAMI